MKKSILPVSGLPRPILKHLAVAALAVIATAGVAHAVDPIVVYSETTSWNVTTASGAELEKERYKERRLVMINTVTKKYQRVVLQPRTRIFYFESAPREFSHWLDVVTGTGKKHQVFSLFGPGDSWLKANTSAFKFSAHDTASGKAQRRTFKTQMGPLEFDAAGTLRGRGGVEQVRTNHNTRTTGESKTTYRISARLTELVNREQGGNTLMYAEAIVSDYLTGRGYTYQEP